MKLELTIDEANQLLSLMDLAVKAGGLQVSAVALPLAQKLQAAANAPPEEVLEEK